MATAWPLGLATLPPPVALPVAAGPAHHSQGHPYLGLSVAAH